MPDPPEARNVRIFVKLLLYLGTLIGYAHLLMELFRRLDTLWAILVVMGVGASIFLTIGLIWHFSGRAPIYDIDRFLEPEDDEIPRRSKPGCSDDSKNPNKGEPSSSQNVKIIYH